MMLHRNEGIFNPDGRRGGWQTGANLLPCRECPIIYRIIFRPLLPFVIMKAPTTAPAFGKGRGAITRIGLSASPCVG